MAMPLLDVEFTRLCKVLKLAGATIAMYECPGEPSIVYVFT